MVAIRFVPPWKNSTLETVPSESKAAAVKVMLPGAANTALFAGLVIDTVGGVFAAFTITVIGAEVAVWSGWLFFTAVATAVTV